MAGRSRRHEPGPPSPAAGRARAPCREHARARSSGAGSSSNARRSSARSSPWRRSSSATSRCSRRSASACAGCARVAEAPADSRGMPRPAARPSRAAREVALRRSSSARGSPPASARVGDHQHRLGHAPGAARWRWLGLADGAAAVGARAHERAPRDARSRARGKGSSPVEEILHAGRRCEARGAAAHGDGARRLRQVRLPDLRARAASGGKAPRRLVPARPRAGARGLHGAGGCRGQGEPLASGRRARRGRHRGRRRRGASGSTTTRSWCRPGSSRRWRGTPRRPRRLPAFESTPLD